MHSTLFLVLYCMQLPRLCERPNNEDGDVSVGVYGYWRSPKQSKNEEETVKELLSSGASVRNELVLYAGTPVKDCVSVPITKTVM